MMNLIQVCSSEGHPYGRITIGPFTQSNVEISELLNKHNVHLRGGDEKSTSFRTVKGIMISCSGEDVLGYLLGDDQLEAPSSDLETFLEDVLVPGHVISIEGHHCPDDDSMVVSNTSAWISNGDIQITSSRHVEHRNGDRTNIHSHAPVSIYQKESTENRMLQVV